MQQSLKYIPEYLLELAHCLELYGGVTPPHPQQLRLSEYYIVRSFSSHRKNTSIRSLKIVCELLRYLKNQKNLKLAMFIFIVDILTVFTTNWPIDSIEDISLVKVKSNTIHFKAHLKKLITFD